MDTKEPIVGDGVTKGIGSDRYSYTIIEVVNPRTIIVQKDISKRIDGNGWSESQAYNHVPNPEGEKLTLTFRKDGQWKRLGYPMDDSYYFVIGERQAYRDPSF